MEQNDSNIDLFNNLKAEIVATEKIDENEESKEEKTLETEKNCQTANGNGKLAQIKTQPSNKELKNLDQNVSTYVFFSFHIHSNSSGKNRFCPCY